jgi:hypothetical protein
VEAQAAAGVDIASEIAADVRETVQGLQIGGPQTAVLSVLDRL